MAKQEFTNPLQVLFGIWVLGWILRIICFILFLVFAILATPIWLIFKTKFNPWTVFYLLP